MPGLSSAKPPKLGVELSGKGMVATTISSPFYTEDKDMSTAVNKNSSRQYGALRDTTCKPAGDSHCGSCVSSRDRGSVGIVPSRHMPSSVHNGMSSQGKTQHNRCRSHAHHHHGGSNARGPMNFENVSRDRSSSMHSGTATREPSSSMHAQTATRETSSSMHSGTATRETLSSMHSGTATKEPSSSMHSGTGTRRLPQSSYGRSASGSRRNSTQKSGGVRKLYQSKNDARRNSRRTESPGGQE